MRPFLVASLASLVLTGVAAGGTFKGSSRPDTLRGTPAADVLYGYGGNDRIDAGAGNDLVSGGAGRDVLLGGPGNDRVASADGDRDRIDCGPGRDIVTADLDDRLSGCEVVSRRLSRDPYRGGGAQHQTAVEPDSFAWGKTIVTAFQVGRFLDGGGAANLAFATSRDAGATWTTGVLPSLSVFSVPSGVFDRVSDPVVVYDSVHRTWMISAVVATADATALTVSRSRDGITWSAPVTAAKQYDGDYDKEWLACDNWRSSPYRGRCYLSYMDFDSQGVMTRHSSDGGRTWSAQTGWLVPPRERDIANGAQPVVRRNGDLVVPFAIFGGSVNPIDAMASTRSLDGGASFQPAVAVSSLDAVDVYELRVPPLPSVAIDGSGVIYLAWTDCRYVSECDANGIVVSKSRDGASWSVPTRVPTGGRGTNVNHFLPGLAATGRGSRSKLALAYYSAPIPTGCNYDCADLIDAWLSISENSGRTWRPPQRLSTEVVHSNWLADTGLGRMLGDYISTSWVAGNAIPVFPLASAPLRGSYREAVFATQTPLH